MPVKRSILLTGWAAPIGVAVGWPAVRAVYELARGLAGGGAGETSSDFGLLLRSVGVAGLIAVLATALAAPVAWWLRSRSGSWFALLMTPLVLPSYLAYSGWGVLRAPDMALGKWLMMGATGAGGAANWYPVFAGYVLAVGGLVLWSWPLAAMVLLAKFRRIDRALLESMKLEAGPLQRAGEVVKLCRGALRSGVGVVMLVMLGSAVPLHLAQLDTYAIHVWRQLDQTPIAEHWRVWAGAWPLLLIAVAGAAVVARKLLGAESDEVAPSAEPRRRSRTASAMTLVIWLVAVPTPIGLLVAGVRHWGVAKSFVRVSAGPLENSLLVSACLCVLGAGVAVWVWMALASKGWNRRIGVGCVMLLLCAGLWPGVLIGTAMSRAWGGVIGDSPLIVVVTHFARFGVVGALAGWWLAATESPTQRDLREIDAAGSIRGWISAALRPQWGAIAAAGLASGLLSFQEIESTVMVQPPSAAGGSFAWLMLQWLHFSRMDELAIGILLVVGLAVVAGVGIVLGCRAAAGSRSNGSSLSKPNIT